MSWPWYDEYDAKLDQIIALLNKLIIKEAKLAINLDNLTAKVTKVQGAEDSAAALLAALSAYIHSLPASNDPVTQAALDDLAGKLDSGADALAAAVVANPVIPGLSTYPSGFAQTSGRPLQTIS